MHGSVRFPLLFVIHILGVALITTTSAWASDEPSVITNSGHSGIVKAVVFAPGGRWMASGAGDSTLRLWDVKSRRLLRILTGHSDEVESVAVGDDGSLVASVSRDNTARIWEAQTGRLLRTIVASQGSDRLLKVTFSHDGKSIWVASFLGVRRWGVRSGTLERTYPMPGAVLLVQSFAMSPDERSLAMAYNSLGRLNKSGHFDSAIRIIDVASGRVERSFNAHSNEIETLEFSPDGQSLVSASQDATAKIWDLSTGKLLHVLSGRYELNSATFSPDGRSIATGDEKGVTLWNAASGRLIGAPSENSGVEVGAFSPDSRLLVFGEFSGQIGLRDLQTDEFVPAAFGTKSQPSLVAVAAPSNEQWVTSGPLGFTIFDATTGLLQHVFPVGSAPGLSAQFYALGKDRDLATITNHDLTLKLWNGKTGELLRSFNWGKSLDPGASIESAALSPDMRWLAASLDDGSPIKLWDVATGSLVRTFTLRGKTAVLAFTTDGRRLVTTDEDDDRKVLAIKIYEPERGTLLKTLTLAQQGGLALGYSFAVAPNDSWIATEYAPIIRFGNGGQKLGLFAATLWDAADGHLLRPFAHEAITTDVRAAAFSNDSRTVATAADSSELAYLWDAASGRLLHSLKGSPGDPLSIAFSPDGRRVIAANGNGSNAVWDVASGELLVATLQGESGEWITITPEGFFTGSEKGAELLHIVNDLDATGIDQVYQALYRPDLVREKLAGDPNGLVKEAAAKLDLGKVMSSGEAPRVTILTPKGNDTLALQQLTAEVEIEDSGGGVGKVEWRVNGVTIGVEDQGVAPGGSPVHIKHDLSLPPGGNAIEVVAYNKANLVSSRPSYTEVNVAAPEGQAKPRLVVLAVGVNDYADPQLKLNFAVPDAQSLADALTKAGSGVYESVDVTLLRDKEVTRDGINAAFAAVSAKVRPNDVFVFYVAGHGKTIDGRYYFGQQDIHVTDLASIAAQGIAQDEWQRWFASIPAQNSLLLFDTCESGSLITDTPGSKALEQQAASGRLAQATGRTILTASSSEQLALEGIEGHGLFTYDLLDALGRADSDGDGMLEVTELAAFVYAQVSMFTENKQVPQLRMSGPDYALVKQTVILGESQPKLAIPAEATHVVSNATEFQIEPQVGARGIHKLEAQTPVAIVHSEQGWVLVAKDGKLLGYVAQGDLAAIH